MIKDKDRNEILHLLKRIIPVDEKAFNDKVEYKIDLFYNGEEVK